MAVAISRIGCVRMVATREPSCASTIQNQRAEGFFRAVATPIVKGVTKSRFAAMAIAFAANLLFVTPFSIGVVTSLKNPSALFFWTALTQVGSRAAAILSQPILLIATAIFYYDLRVRKEAFDLQFMMNPSAPPSAGPGSVPSIL